jgi:hypothetical protein
MINTVTSIGKSIQKVRGTRRGGFSVGRPVPQVVRWKTRQLLPGSNQTVKTGIRANSTVKGGGIK